MQALYDAPAVAREPDCERRVRDWLHFLRISDAMYEHMAEERGEPYQPLPDEEMAAVAQMAASLGIEPADAVARLPAWCAWRLHLQSLRQGGSTTS
jgi:hypothetical protein